MRKKNQKDRTTKMKLDKCSELCVFYDKVQGAVARELTADPEVVAFGMNVPLDFTKGLSLPKDFNPPEETYTTDFVITYADGRTAVREAMFRKHLARPSVVERLELSRQYWRQHGIADWKIVIEKEETLDETR